ncbi:hypothetical protein Dimus_026359 [Dionaea muscipula]
MTVIHLKKKDVVKSSVKGISIEFDHEQCVAILDVHWKKLEFVNTSRRYGKSRGTQNPLRSPRRFANDATIMKVGRVRSVEMKPSRKVYSFYVYADPASLIDLLDEFLFPKDFQRYKEMDASEVIDLSIQEMMKMTLFVRRQHSKNITKLADLCTEVQNYRLSETSLKEKHEGLEKEVDRLKQELSEKNSENNQLMEEMEDIAMNVVIKARGKLMKEFKDEKISEWDVDGDIKLWEDLLTSFSPQTEAVEREGGDNDFGISDLSLISKELS